MTALVDSRRVPRRKLPSTLPHHRFTLHIPRIAHSLPNNCRNISIPLKTAAFRRSLMDGNPYLIALLPSCPLLPASSLNHTRKSCMREGLFSFSWVFVSGGRSSASGSDLGRSMPGQSSMKYDSVYPTLRTAAQARNGLGRELHRGYSAAMPGV
jgi:hypothetical protein